MYFLIPASLQMMFVAIVPFLLLVTNTTIRVYGRRKYGWIGNMDVANMGVTNMTSENMGDL